MKHLPQLNVKYIIFSIEKKKKVMIKVMHKNEKKNDSSFCKLVIAQFLRKEKYGCKLQYFQFI